MQIKHRFLLKVWPNIWEYRSLGSIGDPYLCKIVCNNCYRWWLFPVRFRLIIQASVSVSSLKPEHSRICRSKYRCCWCPESCYWLCRIKELLCWMRNNTTTCAIYVSRNISPCFPKTILSILSAIFAAMQNDVHWKFTQENDVDM